MIDEKKLIERLQRCIDTSDNSNFTNGLLSAIDVVNQQPKIGGWIPCSDRFPDTRNNVLICQKDGYVSIGYYSQDEFLDLNSCPFENVIAWQPLPEAYHG